MSERIKYPRVAPAGYHALAGLSKYVKESGLETSLVELIEVRASQINGCAFCLDMHWKNARAAGESEQRLYSLSAWRETSYYSERERAALAWAEAITQIANNDVSDELYNNMQAHFSEKELVDLTIAVASINAWNRLVISFRTEPGSYQVPEQH